MLAAAVHSDAQHRTSRVRSTRDSIRQAVLHRDSLIRSYKQSDGSLNPLLQKIEYYSSQINQDKSDFSQGFDTLDMSNKLPSVERRMKTMSGLIENDRSSTLLYLFTIRDLMAHIQDDLGVWQQELIADNAKLDKIHADVNEFKKDSILKVMPTDSGLRIKYLAQISQIDQRWLKLDSGIRKASIRIGLLQNRVAVLNILMLDITDKIDLKIHEFSIRSLTNEYGYIWENTPQTVRFDTAASKTIHLNGKLLKYFIDPKTTSHINIISHIAVISILIAFFLWVYGSRRKLVRLKEHHADILSQPHYIVKHPFVSSLLIAFTLGLYLYDQPLFVFLEMLLLIVMGCAGVLIKKVWPQTFFRLWLALLVLLILFDITNLFIQVSYADRLFLFILCSASIAIGMWFIKSTKTTTESYPPHTRIIIKLYVICQVIAVFLNIIGRFSLAKIIGVTATFNLCLGFVFYLFIQILMESLFLQLEANKNSNNFSSYLDFKVLQNKFKNVLVKIGVLLWLVKLTENLDIDDYIQDKISDFLTHSYKFSSTAFTFGSIAIFIFVMWVSIIVSRIISYFYDYAEQQIKITPDVKKARTSILLIRLAIFVIGFLAAVAASGIPMERITLIIGALGVGIGFGLQNIVNNLVSGVILAFEKPVQVGDIIEVGNRSGTIKEIGIRSSKIEAGDGSELIVPNGDLISQHVINWTLSNNNRRIELIIGVAYGSDIAKVEGMLKNIVRNRDDIMQTPPPLVFLHNFSESSVDFRTLFWAADINKWLTLKSAVMSQIYTEFAKEGIEIPHPKRDIQVFFPEGTSAEVKSPDQVKETPPKENPLGDIVTKEKTAGKVKVTGKPKTANNENRTKESPADTGNDVKDVPANTDNPPNEIPK